MSLISMHGAWLSFSDAPLLDNAELHIEDNERVCLVGRNGAGKSTLMKILNREQGLDDGRIIYEQDLIVARLQQDPPRNVEGSVYDFVAEGIEEQAEYLKRYHDISRLVMNDPSEKNLNELAKVQEQLDHHNLWQLENRINEVLAQLGLDPNVALSSLSGGWLRKAALGRALVSNPRVLLLDEPTNHLDIETIDWLEGFLKTFNGTIIFISHDRSFIRNMATRIVDLDRGKLVTYPGNYDQYLLEKEEALRVEELQNAEFDRKLAQEEVWIRQGIKARRTRNEGRVRALKAMRRERGERREVMGTAKMQVEEASRSGKIVFEMEDVCYQVDGKQLVKDFSAQVLRGDKIALIGPNGCGKTTLLKLMLGQLQAAVIHGQQNPFQLDHRIVQPFDLLDGRHQLRQSFQRIIFTLDWDDYAVTGRKGIQGGQAHRRRAVDHNIIVLILDRYQRLTQLHRSVLQFHQLDLRCRQLHARRNQIHIFIFCMKDGF